MILYFNPGHETAVHNASPYYTAPANVVAMQHELAYLPAWYGKSDDVVFVSQQENDAFFSFLKANLPTIPLPVSKESLYKYRSEYIGLWGISPQAVHYFTELNEELELDLRIPLWRDEYTYLHSRQAAHDCLISLTEQLPLIQHDIIPQFYTDLDEIEVAVNNSESQLLAKAPYSSSGRGLLWLPVTGLTRTERQILHGILKKQGSVSVESVLDKQTDFAMEFLSDGQGGLEFTGYSLFYTNAKGGYESNYLGTQDSIEKQLSEQIDLSLLNDVKAGLIAILRDKYAGLYNGCIGVDMMIYKDGDSYRLHPCLEINMRYNMGYLSLRLYENYLMQGVEGRFYLDFSAREGEIFGKHRQMQKQYPAQFANGRLMSGYLALCPVNTESRYRAYILVR
ncbi:hypothetical protein M2451_000042 [Dysgonomonas sp. PFB1-18]|uniref:hypothetical protein n=1 Tax=unclassified Dysgonomonas TaxID=2630389 RepID=UPI002473E8AF|nr:MULTISPECIES: hypothetical protein [unclassified Dysgonomonas]MDH6307592.1 hypothetical protein [Dysgonomonas sp. PF1-14]MDH6337510.1 hypothetical protein [Dysgonomonas sp. PF1-16]MDH6378735.1 hypothetical protein [Dysgonomonas sp. PFB1-18]MDH6399153.1 hypothetical protein [Dysgonomonas sp. PF1-23]